jgi:hypothetical protein
MVRVDLYRMYYSQMVMDELKMRFVEPIDMDVEVNVDHHWMDYLDIIYDW